VLFTSLVNIEWIKASRVEMDLLHKEFLKGKLEVYFDKLVARASRKKAWGNITFFLKIY
jgi:hypothetical protein